MALSYPHKTTFDTNGQMLWFDDGLQLVVKAGTFDDVFECTIDRVDGQTVDGKEPATHAYVFKNFVDPSTGSELDTLPPLQNKTIMTSLPTLVQTTVQTVLTFHTNPEEIPEIDRWVPDPDTGWDPIGDKMILADIPTLKTFEFVQG